MTATNQIPVYKIIAAGFTVYMRKPTDSWAYFTDGTRIGYIQYDRFKGFSLSTVHKPNQTTGTGYAMGEIDTITRTALESAFMIAPHWALRRDLSSVVKYKDWDQFHQSNGFNREYRQVTA